MHFRVPIAFAAVAATLLLSACGPGEPSNIKDLRSVIEDSGYECQDPEEKEDGSIKVDCGFRISAYWFPDAAAEVAEFEEIQRNMSIMPMKLYSIRGGEWHINGNDDAIAKVAEAMGKQIVTTGN